MGQQTILLIALGAIVVGAAVLVGIRMFSESLEAANVDATVNELADFGSDAQEYYKKPEALGGGGSSFSGWSLGEATSRRKGRRRGRPWSSTGPDTTEQAIYTAQVRAQTITIAGTCRTAEKADGDPVTVVLTVGPSTMTTQINR